MTRISNLYDPSTAEIEACYAAIQAVLARHPMPVESFLKDYFSTPEGTVEYLYELGLACGEFWTRVLSSFEIEYYPQELKIEVVTAQFSKNSNNIFLISLIRSSNVSTK